jgi:GH24 family phage-related lysozyme (muramidase)
MSYLDDSVARLTHFEGSVPWMYQDTHAHVTVGVGQMLPSGAGAQALAFVDSTGNSATAAAILAEYQRVQALAPALNAIAYRVSASPQLPDAAISTLLMARVQEFDSALSAQFANYGTFPDPAKLGLLDMIYNLGPHGLFSGFKPSWVSRKMPTGLMRP